MRLVMDKNFLENLNKLKKSYIKKLKLSVSDFEMILNNGTIDIQDLYQRIHKISGTSGMYGLFEISNISSSLEFYLKKFKDNPEKINQEDLKQNLSEYLKSFKEFLQGDNNSNA